MKTLSGRLRWARKAAGISISQLDHLVGLTPGHVRQIETGTLKDIRVSTANRLSKALGISIEWLVTGDGTAPSAGEIRRTVARAMSAVAMT